MVNTPLHSLQPQIKQQSNKKKSRNPQQVGPDRYSDEMFTYAPQKKKRKKPNQMQEKGKEGHVMHLFTRLDEEWGHEFLCRHGEMCIMYDCVWVHMLPLYEGRVPCQPLTTRFVHLLRILGFESTEECSRRAEASLQRDFTYRKMHREQPPNDPTGWKQWNYWQKEVFLNAAIVRESIRKEEEMPEQRRRYRKRATIVSTRH